MTGWLSNLNDNQRKTALEQASLKSGIQVKALEKDWWVTLTLKALFQCPYYKFLAFKGGTSLSKCWKLIQRFSEDIDIALAPDVLGVSYKPNPSKNFVYKLRRLGCAFTSNELKDALHEQFLQLGIPADTLQLEAATVKDNRPDTDPQILWITYPSLFEKNLYIKDVVKLEVSIRSLQDPCTQIPIQSLLNEYFPNDIYAETPFTVTAVNAERTFLEKIFLLHEEFAKTDRTRIRHQRMSRHLYDVERMMGTPAAATALQDDLLYNTIIQHRRGYARLGNGFDYDTLRKETLSFLPHKDVTTAYKEDYADMREQMIYGDAPEFDNLVTRLNNLLEQFRIG